MFSKILIANRGEIACRIIRTCNRLGIKTVAVYSEADALSLAVEQADEAVFIGPPQASESYLQADKIIQAARDTGAEAIHPGFGFLSENADFAKRVKDEGLAWIGPNATAIQAMGDKIESKRLAAESGVNTIPGAPGEIADAKAAREAADEIGYPVMIKASAGGGGKGMRIARSADEMEEGFKAARNEAKSSFGDDRILIEKFIEQPRHIEIQVLGDGHGNVIHLGERECSIQRRNQKVIEEAPSPFIDEATRKKMGEQAVALAKAVDYDSAGTVEFVAGPDKDFYFLEMNTRLQVEHPVTELITGLDLVEQMIRVASGEKLPLTQNEVTFTGWAMEARVYAEDPYRGFLPSIGRLVRCQPPREGDGIRLDTGVREGDEISLFYDPMIAKLIGYGDDRLEAINTLEAALDRYLIEGLQTNIPFVAAVLAQERFREGRLTTKYIEEEFPDGFSGAEATDAEKRILAASAAYTHALFSRRAAHASGRIDGEKVAKRKNWVVILEGEDFPVSVDLGESGEAKVSFGEGGPLDFKTGWKPGHPLFEGALDGEDFAIEMHDRAEGYVMRLGGVKARALVCTPRVAELHSILPEPDAGDSAKIVECPMPGLVVSIEVEEGQDVKAGEPIAIVEAMKMENIIRAETDGKIKSIPVKAGDTVAADDALAEFE